MISMCVAKTLWFLYTIHTVQCLSLANMPSAISVFSQLFSFLVLPYMMSAGHFAGYYFSGDGAHRHGNGYYQITGRTDDVINVSGHRLGTAEIEDVMVSQHLLCLK